MKPLGIRTLSVLIALAAGLSGQAYAGSATNISGLYFTGQNGSGALQSGGGRDANWDVTYAYANGTRYRSYSGNSFADTTYTSTAGAYVLSSTANSGGTANYIDGAYVPNTGSAQWITAPGAMTTTTGGTVNVGGDNLPGNGTTGSNIATYVYQMAFTITGTGTGVVTNAITMSLTVAADDAYEIYVTSTALTLTSTGSVTAQYAASASGTNAWNNTTAQTLTNTGTTPNTTFNIGTNYLTVVVHNTNSVTGSSTNTAINPSGLLMYQVGAVATIDGNPVPEVGTWLPLLGAVGLYAAFVWRRGRMENPLQAA
jgi:hypothetical protein